MTSPIIPTQGRNTSADFGAAGLHQAARYAKGVEASVNRIAAYERRADRAGAFTRTDFVSRVHRGLAIQAALRLQCMPRPWALGAARASGTALILSEQPA